MRGFGLFRLPYAEACTLVGGDVLSLTAISQLSDRHGFVVAPFAISEETPLLLISPEVVEHYAHPADIHELPEMSSLAALDYTHEGDERSDYHIDFANFHARLRKGEFQKLVLSRSIAVKRDDDETVLSLFQKACACYPRMMIALTYTPQSGLWLAATPEILLGGEEGSWQTMALAGTMKYEETQRWSDKNIQEQRYVATYIIRQLERFTSQYTEEGPRTTRAGHLAHLRSDFRFSLSSDTLLGDVLQALHPTPAVCGLPKEDAYRFILHQEHHQRRYYSGFMGPLQLSLSAAEATHLFVNLRCMQIFSDGYRLYAGGGLLPDSVEEMEWQETETKLDTMRNLFIRHSS